MNTYNIYMPPGSGPEANIANAIYLPDKKAWFAALAPPIWLIWHRLWWGLTLYVIYLILVFLLLLTPLRHAVLFLTAIPALYLLLEGHELVRQNYENRGWQQVAVVQANSEEDAEIRYTFNGPAPQQRMQPGAAAMVPNRSPKSPVANPDNLDNTRNSIGIFPLEPSP